MTDQPAILLIGSDEAFHSYVARFLQQEYRLIEARDEKTGLSSARENKPDAIILGPLNPQGSAFKLHRRLRGGWITKYIPLLVVDMPDSDTNQSSWSREDAMQMDAEDYFFVERETAVRTDATDAEGLIKRLSQRLHERRNWFRLAAHDPQVFCCTWEQIPGRGAFELSQEAVFENVERASRDGKVHAISVTDNPGGNPALSTEMLCAAIRKGGMEPLVHLACRDKNRSELESMLYGLATEDVRNILLLTGDFNANTAFGGRPKPVFDIDPVQALQMVREMNEGLQHMVMNKKEVLAPTSIFAGACISPFKSLESEQVLQYYKLKKKLDAGADFLVTQVGYDARKYDELMTWLRINGYTVPTFMNIYLLTRGAAKLMNTGIVPGCGVTKGLVATLQEEAKAKDKGKGARVDRAAKMYAIAKGMGFAGAHIGGHGIRYSAVEEIIDRGEELAGSWQDLLPEFEFPEKDGFYYFMKNSESGLNTEEPAPRPSKRRIPLMYRISRLAHVVLFNPRSIVFKAMRPFARFIDKHPKLRHAFSFSEHMAKVAMFDCMNCGDCSLFDVAFLCPMSQCPKQQRNGPCGGSKNGWCEVYPEEQLCVWVRAYNRLKRYGEEGEIVETIVPPCNWELMHSSSWLNFYLGRDHTAKRLGVSKPD